MRSAHRHLCNQQLFPSVCPSRWTSYSRSTWCRETSPRQSTACETWRSLTSTTSWCTRCVGRDSYVFGLLPGWWASSDRRRRGPVLQIHKIKPNPITNNLICELSQDQAFVCFAWLIWFFGVFFPPTPKPWYWGRKASYMLHSELFKEFPLCFGQSHCLQRKNFSWKPAFLFPAKDTVCLADSVALYVLTDLIPSGSAKNDKSKEKLVASKSQTTLECSVCILTNCSFFSMI